MECVRNGQSRTPYLTYLYWVPLTWGSTLTLKGFKDGIISRPRFVTEITAELRDLRRCCGTVISYDWISLPLVYTQVKGPFINDIHKCLVFFTPSPLSAFGTGLRVFHSQKT